MVTRPFCRSTISAYNFSKLNSIRTSEKAIMNMNEIKRNNSKIISIRIDCSQRSSPSCLTHVCIYVYLHPLPVDRGEHTSMTFSAHLSMVSENVRNKSILFSIAYCFLFVHHFTYRNEGGLLKNLRIWILISVIR
jgi:hypothetical protein